MIYLSMDTFKCLGAVQPGKDIYDECSGILVPQFSISFFFFFLMIANVVIEPLSASRSQVTMKNIFSLKLGWRLGFETTLVSISLFFNLYLFANMNEGRRSDMEMMIAMASGMMLLVSMFMEMAHIIWMTKATRTLTHSNSSSDFVESPIDSTINSRVSNGENGIQKSKLGKRGSSGGLSKKSTISRKQSSFLGGVGGTLTHPLDAEL